MIWFDYFYTWFAPVLVLISFIITKNNKAILLNVLGVVNVLLIAHSIYLIRQYIAFYELAQKMNVKIDANTNVEIEWEQIKDLLILFLPFLFLIKPLMSNRILTVVMIFLLKYSLIMHIKSNIFSNNKIYLDTYIPYQLTLHFVNYISWFALVFSIFWFIKYLPKNL